MELNEQLIQKYNVPGPRYTSYPTVPHWEHEPLDLEGWKENVKVTFDKTNKAKGISVYIHLPFCTHLCHYCGCNVRHTQNHKVEEPYIKRVLKEWKMYVELFQDRPIISELHLGGGTPTFFTPNNLKKLVKGVFEFADKTENCELSFEAHPGNTTEAHLNVLYELGFKRVSFGIQDFDSIVQHAINRVQPFEMVEEVVTKARQVGYESINFDLIYGLPKQTTNSIKETISLVNQLRPDRIAFYSYAHVPWVKGIQRKFSEEDLPRADEKRKLYEVGKRLLLENGYTEIGMDHFGLDSDDLVKAYEAKKLHRNFMGYSTNETDLMIGLGVSSIGDSWTAFAQNYKQIRNYEKAIDADEFPIFRGHFLTEEDLTIRRHILNLMCHFETTWKAHEPNKKLLFQDEVLLREMREDELIDLSRNKLKVNQKGKPFIRNVCMAFDPYLASQKTVNKVFSQTI